MELSIYLIDKTCIVTSTITWSIVKGVSKAPQVEFQLYSGNTDEGLKGGKAHG